VQVGGLIPAVGDRPGGLEILSGVKPGDILVRPEGA
jgi:multidrug efflux system membrane fusion protein